MRLRAVLTDLDGTLLEPDGTVHPDVPPALALLRHLGIPVCLVTSKTVAELEVILADLGLHTPAGFENGAGVRRADGAVELSDAAVPVAELRDVLVGLRACAGGALRSLEQLSDAELAAITGLSGEALPRARQRRATLPLVVDPNRDEELRRALPNDRRFCLVRGNRFLHLQGLHDKADVAPRLLELTGARDGLTVACGDAPNDAALLAAAQVRVIVPSVVGPHGELARRFTDARVAPAPHGRGWAAALTTILTGAP
jgi:mannosyl-3-phosphoglycerate phosphatase